MDDGVAVPLPLTLAHWAEQVEGAKPSLLVRHPQDR